MKLGQYIKIYNKTLAKDHDIRKILTEELNIGNEEDFKKQYYEYVNIKPEEIDINQVIKVGKRKFKLENDFINVKFEQWLFMQDFINENDIEYTTNNYSAILSLFLRPVNYWGKIKPFNKDDIDELSEYFELEMDVELAIGLVSFFLLIEKSLLKCISAQFIQIQEKEFQLKHPK